MHGFMTKTQQEKIQARQVALEGRAAGKSADGAVAATHRMSGRKRVAR